MGGRLPWRGGGWRGCGSCVGRRRLNLDSHGFGRRKGGRRGFCWMVLKVVNFVTGQEANAN